MIPNRPFPGRRVLGRLWRWANSTVLGQRLRRAASGARQGWRAPVQRASSAPAAPNGPSASQGAPQGIAHAPLAPGAHGDANAGAAVGADQVGPGERADVASKSALADASGLQPAIAPERLTGATLVGHPYLISGRGEDLRAAAHAFDAARLPFDLCNTFGAGQRNASQLSQFPYFDRLTTQATRRAHVFFLNADEMASARAHLGQPWFSDALRIGCWAWELSRFPDAWLPALDHVDEIWAPSRFIQQAISERTTKPVVRMPLVVEPTAADHGRERFRLPPDQFLFLFFFDFTSFIARKNPYAALRALKRAFPAGRAQDVGMVIKLNGGQLRPDDYQAFKAEAALGRDNVYLIDEVLSDGEIGALMKACDAFISLHRSEGFGRGPAEAMYFGKPVVTTAYSGNLDYCNDLNCWLVDYQLKPVRSGEYPQPEGQVWAEPDIDQAAELMRQIVDQPAEVARRVERACEGIRRCHSAEAIGAMARRRLVQLGVVDAVSS